MGTRGSRALFRNLDPHGRRNLALTAVFAFYISYIGVGLYLNFSQKTLVLIGKDYLAFWSAGYLANAEGYARAYDLDALRRVQDPWIPDPPDPSLVFVPIPAPLLPFFLAFMRFLSVFSPGYGALIWLVGNIAMLVIYVRMRMLSDNPSNQLLCMVLGSFPVFWDLVLGQTNFWLLVCVGEFLRAMRAGRSFRAGLWLGGLWLKPQSLVLMVPALLLQRAWRGLAGLAVASLAIWGVSFGIGGPEAMHRLLNLWFGYASGLPTNDTHAMVNWRMIGIHLSSFLDPRIGWGIALLGLLGTALASLYLWRRPLSPSSPEFGIALLGTMAATGVVAWHSHVHMMVILIPPMLYLLLGGYLPMALVDAWLFLMPTMMFIGLVLDALGTLSVLPAVPDVRYWQWLTAITGWGLNLYFLLWAVRRVHRLREQE